MKPLITSALPLLSLCFLAACSESSTTNTGAGKDVVNQNEVVSADGSNIDGSYAAEMWPVNYNLHFKNIGMAGVQRTGDTFEAMVNLKYAPRGVVLKPAIYTARRCPNINDDLNKDAYIDINEARRAIGKITIPFDGDLDSQMGGYRQFAASGADGKYAYHQTASFERMFSDLQGVDEDPSDELIKIPENDGLTFPGRIVLIQGVADSVPLPETVGTADGDSAHESLPVACGVLWKVKSLPAELTN